MTWRTLRPLFLFLFLGCPGTPTFPGDEVMGTFTFQAELLATPDAGCEFMQVPPSFNFQGTFSRYRGENQAWLTLGGVAREAVFDGQTVVSQRSAARRFDPGCNLDGGCKNVSLEETIRVALLSKSQDAELERQLGAAGCPPQLDAGFPPADEDAGIRLPDSTERGFDAVRACGVLVDVVLPDPGDPTCSCCQSCTMVYRVRGERR